MVTTGKVGDHQALIGFQAARNDVVADQFVDRGAFLGGAGGVNPQRWLGVVVTHGVLDRIGSSSRRWRTLEADHVPPSVVFQGVKRQSDQIEARTTTGMETRCSPLVSGDSSSLTEALPISSCGSAMVVSPGRR